VGLAAVLATSLLVPSDRRPVQIIDRPPRVSYLRLGSNAPASMAHPLCRRGGRRLMSLVNSEQQVTTAPHSSAALDNKGKRRVAVGFPTLGPPYKHSSAGGSGGLETIER
jgi:hypothetical protein